MKHFSLSRHDLTYYFHQLYRLCHGGKDDFFAKDQEIEETEYRHKREKDTDKVWECARRVLTINELQCFYLHFFESVQQERIAQLMEITQEAVNKFLKKSIVKVRDNLCVEEKQLLFDVVYGLELYKDDDGI